MFSVIYPYPIYFCSVESLPIELKDYFNLLVVFDYDTLIPSRALETIWNKDDIDTESYLSGRFCTYVHVHTYIK